jgi:hypothetical protein
MVLRHEKLIKNFSPKPEGKVPLKDLDVDGILGVLKKVCENVEWTHLA